MEDLLVTKDELTFSYYTIGKYDELCEEHFRIEKIIPLKRTKEKTAYNIILNILTGFIIQFIYGIFPKLEKFICYEETSLENSQRLFIHCTDGKFYFTDLNKCTLPKISNPDILLPEINYSLELILFKFKLFTYIFNSKTNKFDSLKFQVYRTKQEILEKMIKGLKDKEREYQRNIYGECDLNFYVRSFLETAYDNMCDFFFFFQVFAIVLWCFTGFAIYAAVVSCLVIYSLIDTTIEVRSNLLNIRRMSRYSISINLYESNAIKEIQSVDLVPGDVFELPPDNTAIPCDCILLSGSVIVNEAMLTGESTPIIKAHLPLLETRFDYEVDSKHMLFSGTKIVQKRPENKKPLLCVCYATGFNTVRGNLIRSVLFPKEGDTSFMVDSINVLKIIGIIFLVGFISLLPYKIWNIINTPKNERGEEIKELFFQVLDLLTQAVPPELPLCLGICLGIAQKRCKKNHITCINKEKINSAGKIKVCVFDKTGTLTEDHLDIYSYVPITVNSRDNLDDNKRNFIFGQETRSVEEMSKNCYKYYKDKIKNPSCKSAKNEMEQLFIECLACCQGATRVHNELIGDPIDVQMFNATGWNLVEEPNDPVNYNPKILTFVRPSEEKSLTEKLANLEGIENAEKRDNIMRNHYELGIMRRFDFESKLQRMSSVVKSITGTSFMCYCKGSPEKISELCQENTIPDNFNEVLNRYTSQGFRVLALSCKVMQMTYDQAIEIPRDLAEKDLIFLGLLIVENQLKEATSGVLKSLSEEGHLRVRMATGDNILTAICVSRKSNLISPQSTVYSCEIEEELVDENENNKNIINTKNNDNEDDDEYNKSGIQKEKKKIKKLIWKTIENFNDLDFEDQQPNLISQNTIRTSQTSDNKALMVLLPQEVDDDEDEVNNNSDKKSDLNSKKVTSKNNKNKEKDNIDEFMNINVDLTQLPFNNDQDDFTIAIAGKTFEMLYYMNQKYESYDEYNENNEDFPISQTNTQREMAPSKLALQPFHEAFRLILRHASVYARCSPDNKTQLVQSLQKEGFQVLMCGDGANDCGALKAADVGVSLSQEEASIAAPFTSTNPDIKCIIEVLNQGKCALVTSVEIFKYMIIFSLTEFFAMSLMMFRDSFLFDYQSIAIDIIITLPLCTFLPMTGAYETFNYNRPYSNLASFPIFISVFFQFLLNALFQLGGYFIMDFFFPKSKFQNSRNCKSQDKDKMVCDLHNDIDCKDCLDNSIIFYVSFAQYLFSGLVLVTAAPFKKRIYTNYTLFIFVIISFIYVLYIILFTDYISRRLFHLIPFPDDTLNVFQNVKKDDKSNLPNLKIHFKFYLVMYSLLNFFVCLFFEKVVVSLLIKIWSKKQFNKNQKEMRKTEIEPTLNLINDVKNYVREHEKKKKKKKVF